MKRIYLFVVIVTISFALLQSAEARGGSHSFSSMPHFSAPARSYSAPSRSYSSAASRYYSASRFSSMSNRSSFAARPRFSPTTTALRNPTYMSSRQRFSGDRTAAFNSRTYSQSSTRSATTNRMLASRSQGSNRERVVARYSANWHRNWDRGRDHFWHGHRCHFRNGFWFIYDPFLFYPFGYGYDFYPYGSYADATYYDDGYSAEYAPDQYAPDARTNQPEYDAGSQVSNVQSALAREGYYDGAIDGRLGPATEKGLRRYQRDHGLPVTGNIDRAVTQALRLR
jgi:putative peptidoglycan binding protein